MHNTKTHTASWTWLIEKTADVAATAVMLLVAIIVLLTVIHLLVFLLYQIPLASHFLPDPSTVLPSALRAERDNPASVEAMADDTLPRLLRAMLMVLVGWAFGVLLALVLKNQTDFKDASPTAYVITASLVVTTIAGFILIPIMQQYRNEKLRLSLVGQWQRMDGTTAVLTINRWHMVVENRLGSDTYEYDVRRQRLILYRLQTAHEMTYEIIHGDKLLLDAMQNDSAARCLAGQYRRVFARTTWAPGNAHCFVPPADY